MPPFRREINQTRSSRIHDCILTAKRTRLLGAAAGVLLSLVVFSPAAFAQTSLTPTLSFGINAVGDKSASKTATLKNNQTVPLTITRIVVSGGTAPSDYAESGNCPMSPSTLGAGQSCSINVVFAPSIVGSCTATLTVTDSSSNSPQSVALLGTGVAPVALSPGELSFGVQPEGITSAVQTVTLTNAQIEPLKISTIEFSGTAEADYAAGGTCPVSPKTLGAGLSCNITVTFTPSAVGSRTASLTITDGVSSSPQTVTMAGTAIAPVAVAPTSQTFTSRTVGTTSGAQTLTITNDLGKELLFSSIAVSGDFAIASNTCGSGIGAGLKCTVGVSFTPTSVGQRPGAVTINDNAFGSPIVIALSGTGNDTNLNSITVTPATTSIAAGAAQQFVATGHLKNGTLQILTQFVTWSSSQANAATVAAGGIATGVGPGSTNISATLGGIAGSTTLTVTEPKSIAVTPATASIAPGSTQKLSATGSSTSTGVDWSATCGSEGACGTFNPTHTASGSSTMYTAPSSVPYGNTVTAMAASSSDQTTSASANLTISSNISVIAVDVGIPLNATTQPILPFVDGVTIFVNWAGQIAFTDTTTCTTAPCTPTFDFSGYDQAITSYTSATCGTSLRGKGSPCIVNLTFPPVTALMSYNSNTPTWVFSQAWADTVGSPVQDAAFCSNYPQDPNADPLPPAAGVANINTTNCGGSGTTRCTGATVATGVPAIWEKPYVTAINDWHQAIIQHYASATYPVYLRLGVSIADEAAVTCATINGVAGTGFESLTSPPTAAGLKAAWTGAAVNQITFNAAQRAALGTAPSWQLMNTANMAQDLENINGDEGVDPSWAVVEADAVLANQPYAIGTEGLQNGQLSSDLNNVANTFCTGPDCCSDDWCNVHIMVQGKVPAVELQECNLSNPAGGTTNCLDCIMAGTCTNDSQTLSQVLVLAAQHGTTVQELYLGELLCAFDQPSYVSTAPSCTPAVSTAYAAAIEALAIGQ
ncbi:MAG: choice-of-anchor D domain-containing protein [Candidatus Sulfotelmatobacter sp.]|jgi:Big-like domain-containing protein/centrosomal CEP192-like protein